MEEPDSNSRSRGEAEGKSPEAAPDSVARHRPLPAPLRILLYFAGWLLLLVGLLGLALPGIQGLLTLALGASVLSLASEAIYRWLKSLFRPWPTGWKHLERFRSKLHDLLTRRHR